jgi:peroxiredoxin Q/BCP
MRWYAFPESARNRTAPAFRLMSGTGRPISLADYRGRSNLVLFFAHGTDCTACCTALAAFAAHRAEYRAQATEVLVVAPVPTDATPKPSYLEFLVLSDATGEVRRAYAALLPNGIGDDEVLLFVLDRYGAPYAALACPEADDPALQREVLEWLAFIEMQCPE